MARILGISGGPELSIRQSQFSGLSHLFFHDAAAAAVDSGEVVAAAEEERFTRHKHTNAFPAAAAKWCMSAVCKHVSALDAVAFFFDEAFYSADLLREMAEKGRPMAISSRELLTAQLSTVLNAEFPKDRLFFVRHHDAHNAAAYSAAGFDTCLSVVIDGNGETESLSVYSCDHGRFERIGAYPVELSLGRFYRRASQLLGFGDFGEYKVMGLAPYGDAASYFTALDSIFSLEADGHYSLSIEGLTALAFTERIGSTTSEPHRCQRSRDFAAAVQFVYEQIASHVIESWRQRTRHSSLVMSGGCAMNCAFNGKLVGMGGFSSVYVHPAPHDAGAAIGAALVVARSLDGSHGRSQTPKSPFLGPDLDSGECLLQRLNEWSRYLAFKKAAHVYDEVANELEAGRIVAFAADRAEFGPRALGNRSILADPRPRSSWTRINKDVKRRESFRPFAPMVLEEYFDDYFVRPLAYCNMGYMGFVVGVREDKRDLLLATTHVDGTARVQSVSEEGQLHARGICEAFYRKTGCPVVLNTSFNNRWEPIVQSAGDAIRTFLTADIDVLVLGDYFVTKRQLPELWLLELVPTLEEFTSLVSERTPERELYTVTNRRRKQKLSNAAYWAIANAEGRKRIGSVVPNLNRKERTLLSEEVFNLWEQRFLDMKPD